MHAFDLEPVRIEKISSIGRGPKWKQKHRTHIPKDKEKTLKEMKTITDDITLFTGGSRIDGVGASAVMYRNGQERQTLHKHLRKEEEHTVFEAEVVGAILGIHLVSKTN